MYIHKYCLIIKISYSKSWEHVSNTVIFIKRLANCILSKILVVFFFFFFIDPNPFTKFLPKTWLTKNILSINCEKNRFPTFSTFLGFYYPKEEPEFLNDLYQLEQEIRDKRRTEGALRFVRRNDNSFDELMLSKKLLKRDLLKRLLMNTRKQWFENIWEWW